MHNVLAMSGRDLDRDPCPVGLPGLGDHQQAARRPPLVLAGSRRGVVGRSTGVVPLAAALTIPLTTSGAVPERDLVLVLATAVIVISLVTQAFALEPLARHDGIAPQPRHGTRPPSPACTSPRRACPPWNSSPRQAPHPTSWSSGCAATCRPAHGRWKTTPARPATPTDRQARTPTCGCAANCSQPSGMNSPACTMTERSARQPGAASGGY